MNLKYAKTLKINPISERCWEVGSNSVFEHIKPGRSLLTCSCTNDGKFCNESPFCAHKLKVISYEVIKDAKKLLEYYIEDTQRNKELKLETNNLMVLDMLNKVNKLL